MILPNILPDEWARSFLGRICRLNGASSPDSLRAEFERSVSPALNHPKSCSWVELLAAATQMTPGAFFTQHTLLPFIRAVRPERECLPHGERRDKREAGAHAYSLGLTDANHFLCPACVAEDLAFWGTSYWRRSHQLRGTASCEKHGLGLRFVQNPSWSSLPHDEVAHSISLPASVIEDAARNPVIARYAEICSGLAMRDCPVATQQMVETIRNQFECVNTSSQTPWPRLSSLVVERIRGPWQMHFFGHLTGSDGVRNTESLERTQSCVRLAYATHFYALALAVLFDSADDALARVNRPTVASILRKAQYQGTRHHPVTKDNPTPGNALTDAARAFLHGTSIADACRIHGECSRQLEALLRAAADPLRLVLEQAYCFSAPRAISMGRSQT